MARKILHLDLDAFFCAVEELRDPTLRGKAFAVGGRPDQRGVVASCSYPARSCGIHSAMPMSRALRLCPDLIIVPGRHRAYEEISDQVMTCLRNQTALVEQISIDEAFLDLSDLPDAGADLARRLQLQIARELRLPCSLGVATNKLVAKIANDVGKASAPRGVPPNAVTVVAPGQEAEFLAPLPVDALWGIGPKSAERLEWLGIRTIGQLATYPTGELVRMFGKTGAEIAQRALGMDDRPIVTTHEVKSISQETTFVKDTDDFTVLRATLFSHSESVGKRLRQANLAGSTVRLKLRWPDFSLHTRQASLAYPTDQDMQIFEMALQLLLDNWKPGQAIRLLGVGVSGLQRPVRQLSLWETFEAGQHAPSEKERRLQTALDELRQRFGANILQRGAKQKP